MQITKALPHIISGLVSLSRREMPWSERFSLLKDYVRLAFLVMLTAVNLLRSQSFFISTYHQTVFFENIFAFFFLFNEIYINGEYEIKGVDPVVFFDCGANIGMATLWISSQYPDCEIIAFEPASNARSLYCKNIEVNKLTHVTLHPVALSDHRGVADFYYIKDNVQVLDSGLTLNQPDLPYSTEQVEVEKISSYISRFNCFLKLDIEGGEYAVIPEIEKSGRMHHISSAIIEFHFPEKNRERYMIAKTILSKYYTLSEVANSPHTTIIRCIHKK